MYSIFRNGRLHSIITSIFDSFGHDELFFEILFKMSIYQISQLVRIYKKCEAKKGVNVAKYSPITFC